MTRLALVTVQSYRDPIDAELAKTRLEDAGIRAVLFDQYLASIQWLYSRALGGVRVKVEETDLQRAREILREDRSADLLGVPEGEASLDPVETCPVCGSSAFHPSRLQRNAAALTLLTGLPFVAWRRRWTCDACGHSWKRSRARAEEVPEETHEADVRVMERRSYPILRVIFAVLVGVAILYYVQLHV